MNQRILLRHFLWMACSVAFLLSTTSARAGFVIGGFDATRYLDTSANPTHTSIVANFPDATFSYTPTLTPAYLNTIDVLVMVSARGETTAVSGLVASEQSALLNFVKGGGNALILADGFSPFLATANTMVSPFGLTEVDDGLTGLRHATPLNHTHPVINGPFGDTTGLTINGAGVFSNLGPYAISLANLDATGGRELVSIPENAIQAGSGRVVIYGDVSCFVSNASGGQFNEHEALWLNTIAYLSIPEPSSATLAMQVLPMLLAGGLVSRLRGRRRVHARDQLARTE